MGNVADTFLLIADDEGVTVPTSMPDSSTRAIPTGIMFSR